jgi:hypothetical protein
LRLGLIVAVVSLTALGDVPAPRKAGCQADAECVITTFDGCCGSCGCKDAPRAMRAADLKNEQARCAVVDCARPNCPPVACVRQEPASSFRAVCSAGACVAERIAKPTAECRSNADCRITYPPPVCRPGPCGCCPGTVPKAISITTILPSKPREEAPPPPPPAPQQAPKNEVKFGLSPAPTTPPTPVNCSPCPAPDPAEAQCNAGRCEIAPTRVRPPG